MIGLLGSLRGLLGRGPGGGSGGGFGGLLGGFQNMGGAPGTEALVNSSPSILGTGPTVKEFGQAVAGNMVPAGAGGGNDWQKMVQMAEAPASTAQVPQRAGFMQRAQNWMGQDIGNGMSRADALYTIGAGLKDMDPYGRGGNLEAAQGMFRQRDQQREMERRKAAVSAYADQMGLTGRERLAFELAPEEWIKGYAMPMKVGENETLVVDGKPVFRPLQVEKFEDRFGAYDPLSGNVSYSAARGPTFAEQSEAEKRAADIQARIRELNIALQRLGLDRERHNARLSSGGYGTPGVGSAAAFDGGVPDGWEIQ